MAIKGIKLENFTIFKKLDIPFEDVIIEMEKEVIFMEFKNYDLSQTRVGFSELNTLKKNNQIARKYYDSFLTISSITELTKKKYRNFFVLNHTQLDTALRFRLYEIIRKSLPFRFFKDIKEVDKPLINEFRLLDIEGWNNLFPQFKLEKL